MSRFAAVFDQDLDVLRFHCGHQIGSRVCSWSYGITTRVLKMVDDMAPSDHRRTMTEDDIVCHLMEHVRFVHPSEREVVILLLDGKTINLALVPGVPLPVRPTSDLLKKVELAQAIDLEAALTRHGPIEEAAFRKIIEREREADKYLLPVNQRPHRGGKSILFLSKDDET